MVRKQQTQDERMKKTPQIFRCIYLSFHKSNLKIRAKVSFTEEEISHLYFQLKEVFKTDEAFVISTCNRTEIYYLSQTDVSDEIISYLSLIKEINNKNVFSKTTANSETVKRLFRVGLGLESQILGDQQIIHQFKKAYQQSCDANMAGVILHKTLHTLFHTNKRVVNETKFCSGQASIAYVAAQLINSFQVQNAKILVIGIGEFGKEVTKNIKSLCNATISLTNRSKEKAESLAKETKASTIAFSKYLDHLHSFDIIINCAHKEGLIKKEHINGTKKLTYSYFIDLSVSHAIEKDIESITGNIYYNLDDLKDISDKSLEVRKKSIPKVEKIIEEETSKLINWQDHTSFNPVLTQVKNTLEEIRKKTITSQLKSLDENNLKVVNEITLKFMNELIKMPALDLQQRCMRGEDTDERVKILSEIFSAEEKKPTSISSQIISGYNKNI